MTYHSLFNEYQRKMFIRALSHLASTQTELLKGQPGDDSVMIPNDTALEEVETMIDMLHNLPELEASDPGFIHGLCL